MNPSVSSVCRQRGAAGRASQRGMTIPMLALSLFAIMAIAALAIDVGVLYTARTSAQHAADAAALAGAGRFLDPICDASASAATTCAQQAAIATAAQNQVLGNAVTIAASNVTVDYANRRVVVTVPLTGTNAISTFFAQVAGSSFSSIPVQTKATAEAAAQGTSSGCLKPIFLPNTILADPTLTVQQACGQSGGQPQVMFNPTGSYSDWFQSQVPGIFGTELGIRPTNPGSALLPSQFYSLQLGSPGASTYRCNLGSCLNECGFTPVQCGSSFPVETGNMNGPTNQGVTNLISDFNTTNPDLWYPNNPTASGFAYEIGGDSNNLQYYSKQVVVAPVWNDCTNLGGQDLSSGYHGQAVQVIGFATLFVEGMSGGNVMARLVNSTLCGGGTPGPGSGPFGVPIRLVQNQ